MATKQWEVDDEDNYLCPITGNLMEDPCTISCGHTFERSALTAWFARNQNCCPMGRCELKEKSMIPNINLRTCIRELLKKKKTAIEEQKGGKKHQPPFAVLFLGNTGVGKSHLIEDLTGLRHLAGACGQSFTAEVKSYSTQSGLVVIDTPGLADTMGRSLEYLNAIVAKVRSCRCLPAIVIQYEDKFTSQFTTCLEAVSLCLNLLIHDYILIVNKVTYGGRGAEPSEVIAQLVEQVSQIIGRPPLRVIEHQRGAVFPEHVLLPSTRVFALGAVYTIEELWDRTNTKIAKIEYILDRVRQFMHAEEQFLAVSAVLRKEGLSRLMYGADEVRSSIVESVEERRFGKFFLGVCALPFAELGSRLLGGGELISSLLASPVELVIDGITINWKRPTEREQRFLAENQNGVIALFEKLERVREFYSIIRKPAPSSASP